MFEEMKGRIKEDDTSVPAPDGPLGLLRPLRDRRASTRSMRAARAARTAAKQVLLDADALAKGKAYFQVGARRATAPTTPCSPRPRTSRARSTTHIHVKDLATGEVLPGAGRERHRRLRLLARQRSGCSGSGATRTAARPRSSAAPRAAARTCWSTRSRTTACSSASASPRPTQLHRHRRRQPGDQRGLADPGRRPDRRAAWWSSRATSGVRYDARALGRPLGDPHQRRRRDRLQADAAPTRPSPARANWQRLDPPPARPLHHRRRAPIAGPPGPAGAGRRPQPHRGHRARRAAEHAIAFDEEAYALGLEGGYEFDTDRRCASSTSRRPRRGSGSTTTWPRASGPCARPRRSPPATTRPTMSPAACYATAPDGAAGADHRADARRTRRSTARRRCCSTATAPTACRWSRASRSATCRLVDRGWIWAIAHIRGGSEKGWGWFLDGRKDKKTNTFTDFIACAEHLIAEGYGAPGRIVA